MSEPTNDARAVIAGARLRESTLRLCLRGDLMAAHQDLESELERATRADGYTAASLADQNPAIELSQRIVDLQAEMDAASVTFRFRALRRSAWESLLAAHPAREGKDERWNWETFAPALVSACLVDPAMSVAEVGELFDVVNERARDALFGAAFSVNMEGTEVPFSERASAVIRWREQNSKPLEPGASPAASS